MFFFLRAEELYLQAATGDIKPPHRLTDRPHTDCIFFYYLIGIPVVLLHCAYIIYIWISENSNILTKYFSQPNLCYYIVLG